jgi:GDP-mannose transporter
MWFGGSVTSLTLVSFGFMVVSSVLAAYADYTDTSSSSSSVPKLSSPSFEHLEVNLGYVWMLLNCIMTASYVLAMRKRIKLTNFKASSFDL